MNYRHAFHAGNFADVVKHAAFARVLVHLGEKVQAFRVIDTHAGAGLYDLAADAARRTGEWREGIARLHAATLTPDVAPLLAPYLAAVAAVNPAGALARYPGSPLIALSLMRPQDRLVACELEPKAAAALAANLRRDARARPVAIDGFTALKAYLPPKERRGVVLIDPPYEAKDEFARLAEALVAAHHKWATGIFMLWYPITDRAGPERLAATLQRSSIRKILRAELRTDPMRPPAAEDRRLAGTGLIIINPPWRLPDELARILPALAAALAPAGRPSVDIDWLTPGP